MEVIAMGIQGVFLNKTDIHKDIRGSFYESFNQKEWEAATGLKTTFVQDNFSNSKRGVLRGLHYQIEHPQGKLVRVLCGVIFDVVVDLRKESETFGHWIGMHISSHDYEQLWIPEGCAHGFYVVSEYANVMYKTTDYRYPEHERTIMWNDHDIDIRWPFWPSRRKEPILSEKDSGGMSFKQACME